MTELIKIQSELKAPKNQFNAFGKYKYRNCEDILEALKPYLLKYGCMLTISDQIKEAGGLIYCESSVQLTLPNEIVVTTTGCAGIDPNRKGMDIGQSFGSSSSYARKYALNGLFLIDDSALDPDASNDHTPKAPVKVAPTDEQFAYIVRYLNGTDAQRKQALEAMTKYNFNKEQRETLDGLI